MSKVARFVAVRPPGLLELSMFCRSFRAASEFSAVISS